MTEHLTTIIDLFGMAVALTSVSLAALLIGLSKERYDRSFIVSMYLIGTVLLVVSMEIEKTDEPLVMSAWLLVYCAVGYWVAIIGWKAYSGQLDSMVESAKDAVNGNK